MERLDLQTKLEEFLGSRNVYFQPPATVRMKYPAVVYNLSDISLRSADDIAYLKRKRYQVQIIDANPDTDLINNFVEEFDQCSFDNHFVSDNLNHYNFTIYW